MTKAAALPDRSAARPRCVPRHGWVSEALPVETGAAALRVNAGRPHSIPTFARRTNLPPEPLSVSRPFCNRLRFGLRRCITLFRLAGKTSSSRHRSIAVRVIGGMGASCLLRRLERVAARECTVGGDALGPPVEIELAACCPAHGRRACSLIDHMDWRSHSRRGSAGRCCGYFSQNRCLVLRSGTARHRSHGHCGIRCPVGFEVVSTVAAAPDVCGKNGGAAAHFRQIALRGGWISEGLASGKRRCCTARMPHSPRSRRRRIRDSI